MFSLLLRNTGSFRRKIMLRLSPAQPQEALGLAEGGPGRGFLSRKICFRFLFQSAGKMIAAGRRVREAGAAPTDK